MDIKDLKVFHTIAKEESIAKASRILYMTPQGISKIVKNLEAEMGCRLFTRNKSGMQLTESGRRFLEYADKDIELLFAAIDTKPIDSMLAQLESVGDLTVTSFEYPNSVKLDKYPVTYKQVSDFQTWIEEHVTANDDKLYVITGSLYFISQVRKWILEQERSV